MKKTTSFFCRPLLTGAMLLMILTSCESQSGPGPDIHDRKYIALDADGRQLEPGQPGPCVLDQFTGLVWEVKTDAPGLHHREHRYSWFDPGEDADGELDYRGKPDGGNCFGSACDTYSFAMAISEAGHCGYADWRVPTRDELGSISDPRKTDKPPTINTDYFPHTQPAAYWSRNDYQFHWNAAWLWDFGNGLDRVEWKETPAYLRLVRGEAMHLERVKD
ncbi:MAG: DUF1566 domain-containing protein [Xanthomonadales bacterium]|nr:DUF1566 domain-containing protein [Xanthomonadales bacterium]